MPSFERRFGRGERALAADRDDAVDAVTVERLRDVLGAAARTLVGVRADRAEDRAADLRQALDLVAGRAGRSRRRRRRASRRGCRRTRGRRSVVPLSTTPRMTAFRPGQSPPLVRMPIFMLWSSLSGRGESATLPHPTLSSDAPPGHTAGSRHPLPRPPAAARVRFGAAVATPAAGHHEGARPCAQRRERAPRTARRPARALSGASSRSCSSAAAAVGVVGVRGGTSARRMPRPSASRGTRAARTSSAQMYLSRWTGRTRRASRSRSR